MPFYLNKMKKNPKLLVVCPPELNEVAKNAGADYYGQDEYFDKIKSGWTDFDLVITTPTLWSKFGQLGRVLAPLQLMPDNKSGFVTENITKPILAIKQHLDCDHDKIICKKCLHKGCIYSSCKNEIYQWSENNFDHPNGCKNCGSQNYDSQ